MGREYTRITALKIEQWDKEKKTTYEVWLPQVEMVEYDDAEGDVTSSKFVCIQDGDEVKQCKTELSALKEARQARDRWQKLN